MCWEFDDTDFTRGIGTHNHTVGFIDEPYRANKPFVLDCCEDIDLTVTSDWRCPQGNANVGGSIRSQHMEGNGGDFAKTDGAALTFDEWRNIRNYAIEELRVSADGISGYGAGGFNYTTHIHIDCRGT